jgi:hypothetical protein
LFPSESGLQQLVEQAKFLHHGTVPEFALDRVGVMRTSLLKDLLEVVIGQSGAPLEIMFSYHLTLFARVLDHLVAMVRHRREAVWTVLFPFFPPLAPFLVLLMMTLVGAIRPPPTAAPVVTKVKASQTSSSPEVYRVAMLSNAFVIFGCSRPSSWTKEWHVVQSQKAEMILASATLGSL